MLLIVKHPREAALDAQCCASIANLGKQKAQSLSTGFGSFSIAEFAEKLVCLHVHCQWWWVGSTVFREYWYFRGILHKLQIRRQLVGFLTWWRIFSTEKIKLNCQKLWPF